MKRKVRKYVEGGYGDVSSEDYGMGSREEMIERNIEENERRRQMAESSPIRQSNVPASVSTEINEPGTAGFSRTPLKSAAKPPIVTKEQMAKAGYDNLRDYMNAQKGLTRRETPASKPSAPKPATQPAGQTAKPMGRTAMGKTAEQEMAAIEAGRKAASKAEIERLKSVDKPLEGVYPEAALIGGPGLKALRALGSGAGSKAAAQAAKPRVEPKIPQEAAKASPKKPDADYYYGAKSPKMAEKPGAMTTKPPRGGEVAKGGEPKGGALATKSGQLARRGKDPEQLEMPKRRLPYEKYMGEAEVVKKPVQKLTDQSPKRLSGPPRGGGKDPNARRPTRDELDEMRMGSDYMRKGGKVGSASRRADGIATRGKTRGRYI